MESETGLYLFVLTRFSTGDKFYAICVNLIAMRTGIHPRIKSEGHASLEKRSSAGDFSRLPLA